MQFSVIICTYNPDKRLILRALKSITGQQKSSSFSSETIVVDNNSTNLFFEDEEIKKAMAAITSFKLVKETKQGLAHARLKGFSEAGGQWIVFVDDDNELESNYLIKLQEAISSNPEVGCWGPGKITVEFVDEAQAFVAEHYKGMFQEKNCRGYVKGNEKGWHPYYPTGSGLCMEKSIFEKYTQDFNSGKLNATGRKGNALSSGEDTQIIWTAIKNGQFVGCSSEMKLVHMIAKKRCEPRYLAALNFNISYDYYKSYYESFEDNDVFKIKPSSLTYLKIFFKSFFKSLPGLFAFFKIYRIDSAWYKGYDKFYSEHFNR
jgi:glycosyltransferase involved in cell wall biosynthesis